MHSLWLLPSPVFLPELIYVPVRKKVWEEDFVSLGPMFSGTRWCSCLPGCCLLCWHFPVKSVTSILLPHFSPGCSEPGRGTLVGLGSHWLQAWVYTISSCWSTGPQVHISLCNKVTVHCGISVWSVDLASAPHSPWEPRIALESWTFEIPSTLGFLIDMVVCQVGARGSYSPSLEWGAGNKQFLLPTVFPNCTSPSRGQSLEQGHSGHTWLTVLLDLFNFTFLRSLNLVSKKY